MDGRADAGRAQLEHVARAPALQLDQELGERDAERVGLGQRVVLRLQALVDRDGELRRLERARHDAVGTAALRQRVREVGGLLRRVGEEEGGREGGLLQRRADGHRVHAGERKAEHHDVRAFAAEELQRGDRARHRAHAETPGGQLLRDAALAQLELCHQEDAGRRRLFAFRAHGALIGEGRAGLDAPPRRPRTPRRASP
jgi:hypothetical protein